MSSKTSLLPVSPHPLSCSVWFSVLSFSLWLLGSTGAIFIRISYTILLCSCPSEMSGAFYLGMSFIQFGNENIICWYISYFVTKISTQKSELHNKVTSLPSVSYAPQMSPCHLLCFISFMHWLSLLSLFSPMLIVIKSSPVRTQKSL